MKRATGARHRTVSFVVQQGGFAGAEKALILCFGLAILALVAFLLSGGTGKAGRDAERTLAAGSGSIGGASQLGQVMGTQPLLRPSDPGGPRDDVPAPRPAPAPVAAPVQVPVAIAVPRVVNVGRIADTVARNQAINQSYNALDTAMTAYLGGPNVSNWTTYGQHASREAGTQIRNLDEGLDILNNALSVLQGIATSNPIQAARKIPDAIQALRRIIGLTQQDGLTAQIIGLALAKAGISPADIQALINDLNALNQWTSAIPGLGQYRQVRVAIRLTVLSGKLVIAIPSIIQSASKVRDNLVKGNREIYENIAPAYAQFLTAANAAPNGNPGRLQFRNDPSGFLSEAFFLYGDVRRLGLEIQVAKDPATVARLTAERNDTAARANLLIGYQEQLVILQPIFDTMQPELKAISGTMNLNDPAGKHPLLPNGGTWGDFYSRLGIDPARAPRDPTTIRPNNLPPLWGPNDRRYQGTIGQYFQQGLNDPRLHAPPPPISRF